jgi:hypothetical protein
MMDHGVLKDDIHTLALVANIFTTTTKGDVKLGFSYLKRYDHLIV